MKRCLFVATAVATGIVGVPIIGEWLMAGMPPFVDWMTGADGVGMLIVFAFAVWVTAGMTTLLVQRSPRFFRLPAVVATVMASTWSILYLAVAMERTAPPPSNMGAFLVLVTSWSVAFLFAFATQVGWRLFESLIQRRGGSADRKAG